MNKYFVRYAYDVTHKIPNAEGLGWVYATSREEESCVLEMEEERVDITEVRELVLRYELNHLGDRKPELYEIDILVLNKL